MNISLISMTEKGRLLTLKLRDALSGKHHVGRYCFSRHCDDDAVSFESVYSLIDEIFVTSDALVFVCACGIAVRSCVPHLVSKASDPAVIVMDENGTYAIPVLSGHLGGANRLAEIIAECTGAEAVITTATDSGKLFSPDSFAAANGLAIADMKAAKEAAAAVVNGDKLGFMTEYPHSPLPCELTEDLNAHTGIAVFGKADVRPFPVTLNLMPKNIVLGIGCRRGTPYEEIESALAAVFKEAGIDISRICAAATIDLKADETGIIELCKAHGIPLNTFSAEELMNAEGEFESSEFVLKTVGTDNVCERSAVLCSRGKLVIRKKACGGITVAAAEKPVYLDFERKIL